MATFLCRECDLVFEDNKKIKKEYHDYIFGPCQKYIAYCPECKGECSEKPQAKPGRAKKDVQMECRTGPCQGPACSRFQ